MFFHYKQRRKSVNHNSNAIIAVTIDSAKLRLTHPAPGVKYGFPELAFPPA